MGEKERGREGAERSVRLVLFKCECVRCARSMCRRGDWGRLREIDKRKKAHNDGISLYQLRGGGGGWGYSGSALISTGDELAEAWASSSRSKSIQNRLEIHKRNLSYHSFRTAA